MRLIDLNSDYIQETLYRRAFKKRQDIEEWLNTSPTIDAVPVVRCRECKYRFKNNGHSKAGCPIIDANIWMDDDDFCSHGERKEGANND